MIPALVSRRIEGGASPVRGVPFDGRVVRGFGGDRRARCRRPPSQLFLAPARQRPGALRRAAPTTCTSLRANRTAWSRRPTPYLRLDGETMLEPGNPATQGQIVVLDARCGGHARRDRPPLVRRHAAAGRRRARCTRPRSRRATSTAAMRPHYLLKEITEAPGSFRKTLRGKIVERRRAPRRAPRRRRAARRLCATRVRARRDPPRVRDRHGHRDGRGRRASRRRCGARSAACRSPSRPIAATEFSGFGLHDDMHDTLVVAISQSGTTTDTNRTVDVAAGARRGRRGDRQPAPERPRRQERRCALHVRRSRRRDECRVDEGVLLADRGRLPARVRAWRRRSVPTTTRRAARDTTCSRRCAICPTR